MPRVTAAPPHTTPARSTWNSAEPVFAWKVLLIRAVLASFWSTSPGNQADDLAAHRHEHLDRRRRYRHAARLHRFKRHRADCAGTESLLRPCLRVSRQTRRPDQTALVGRR